MGKIAVLKLFKLIFILITSVVALITIVGAFARYADPRMFNWLPLISLVFPVLIAFNLFFAVYWAIRRHWLVASIFFVAVITNLHNINLVYQLPFRGNEIDFSKPKPSNILRVVSYNVAKFIYLRPHNSQEDVAKFLFDNNTDIACFQEYRASIYSNDTILGDFRFFPFHAVVDKAPGRLRTAIFSKYPILNTKQLIFDNSDNTALYADIDVNGVTVRVFSIHLQTTNVNQVRGHRPDLRTSSPRDKKNYLSLLASTMGENFELRADQADLIRSIVDTTSYPLIVCSDMNEPPTSFVYNRIRGNLNDGFVSNGKNYGYTFNGFFKLLRIDNILYSNSFDGVGYTSPHLPWSDHNPVVVDLRLSSVR